MTHFFADDDLGWLIPLFPFIGLALTGFSLFASLRACKRRRLIDNLPTSKTQGVFIGLVELKGIAQCEQPLTSYLAAASCVYYSYDIQEQWSRTVTEEESDGKGGTHLVTRRESGWTSVASQIESTPFYMQDDTGHVLVRPDGAKIEASLVFTRTCTPADSLYYGKGPAGGVADSDFIRRFTESVVAVQATLFIVGQARERQDMVAPEIAAAATADEYLISTRTEEEVSSGLGWQIVLFFLLGLVATPLGHLFFYLGMGFDVSAGTILCFIAESTFFFILWLLGWVITVYNSLVALRQRVGQGWGQVDIQLKRRHDLIPNLIDTVKGYRDYEAKTQTALTALRSQLSASAPGQPGDDFHSVQAQVNILKEAYPELKANENFLELQKSLSDTEQRIALARSYFNSIATFYNTRLEVVPDRFIAMLGGMKARELMQANDFERAPVAVDFAPPSKV